MAQVVPIEGAEHLSAGGNITIRASDAVDSATPSSRHSWGKERNLLSLVENGFPSEYSEPSTQQSERRHSDRTMPIFDSDSSKYHLPQSLRGNEEKIPRSDEKASDEVLSGVKAVEGHSTKEEVGDTSLARFYPAKSPKSSRKVVLPSALDEYGEPSRANNGDPGGWSRGESHGLPAPRRGLDSVHDESKVGTSPPPMIMGRPRESIAAEFLARQREREDNIKRRKEDIADILRRVTEKDPAMPNIDDVFLGWSANPGKG